MADQYELCFMDGTSVIGDNNTLTRGNVDYMARALSNKDTWGGAKSAQIGGMVFRALVTRNLTADMSAVVTLATNTTNTLVGGTYIANLNIPANAANGFSVSTVLPKGTTRDKYLGVVVTGSGNIAAGNVTARLSASAVPIID
jgi:hypothetical protein